MCAERVMLIPRRLGRLTPAGPSRSQLVGPVAALQPHPVDSAGSVDGLGFGEWAAFDGQDVGVIACSDAVPCWRRARKTATAAEVTVISVWARVMSRWMRWGM